MNLRYFRSIITICCFLIATMFVSMATTLSFSSSDLVYQTTRSGSHTVAKGETVYSIARLYNITVPDIYASNPRAIDGVKIGDVLAIPSKSGADQTQYSGNTTKTYTVQPKQTLYSIAKEFGVKVEDLIDTNPELKTRPLIEGQILRIPSSDKVVSSSVVAPLSSASKSQFTTHQVQPKETLYGISKQYNVTSEAIIDFNPEIKDGLREGAVIIIPVLENSDDRATLLDVNKISIGIVLPFVNKSNGKSARFVEYYEGFLLALSEMKAKGLSANVYTFDIGSDTGTDKLRSLLDTYEMKYLDVIIGGVSPEQVAVIADFAKKQGIKYVVPFPTKVDNIQTNAQVFQVNAPHSILYSNVAKTFTNLFPSANIIYVTENGVKGDRADFIEALNLELPRAGMIATSVDANQNLETTLASKLDPTRKNVIVPTSASAKMLSALLPALQVISTESPTINISLFGHTDWQTYGQYTRDFAKYDTYIYTPFFFNENDYRSKQFIADYKKWYNNKSMINTYPRYAVLGYDTGISLLTALQRSGKDFESNTNSLSVSSLQTPFLFKKEGALSGYMNNGFYLVRYKPDGSIDKTEYGR